MKTEKIEEFKDKAKMKALKDKLSEFIDNITAAKNSISGLKYDDRSSDVLKKIIECQELETRAVVDSCIAAVRMTQAKEEASKLAKATGHDATIAKNRRDEFAAEAIHLADEARALRQALDKLPDEYKNDVLQEDEEYTAEELREKGIDIKEDKDRLKHERIIADTDRLLAEIDDNINIIRENQGKFKTSETIESLKRFNEILRKAKSLILSGNMDSAMKLLGDARNMLESEELHDNKPAFDKYFEVMLDFVSELVLNAEQLQRVAPDGKQTKAAIFNALHATERLKSEDTAHAAELKDLMRRINVLLGEEPEKPKTTEGRMREEPEKREEEEHEAEEGRDKDGGPADDDRRTRFDLTSQLKAARYSLEEEGAKPEMYRKLVERIHTIAESNGYDDIRQEAESILKIIDDHRIEEQKKQADAASANLKKKGEYHESLVRLTAAVERGKYLEEAQNMSYAAMGFADAHGYSDLESEARHLLEMVNAKRSAEKAGKDEINRQEERTAEREEPEEPMDISFGQDAEELIREATAALNIPDDKKALQKAEAALRIAKTKGLEAVRQEAEKIIAHIKEEPAETRTPSETKEHPGTKKQTEEPKKKERTTKPGGWDAPGKEKAPLSEKEQRMHDQQVLSRLQNYLNRGEFDNAAGLVDEAQAIVDRGVDTPKTSTYLRNMDVARSMAKVSEHYDEKELPEAIEILRSVEKKYRNDTFVKDIIREWFNRKIESADEIDSQTLRLEMQKMRL
ncbi:hypothetical protein KY362_07915 [Candidatus Woesearchaeota archaeon]|nr:hypothetical protein [Candidatus Woesearchaeota archaeon]